MKLTGILKNLHLIISVLIVIPVAFVYGFNPEFLFDIHPKSIDELNVFSAIMGLYISFALIWLLGIYKTKYWTAATIANAVFMFGLGFGRCLSIICDGIPSNLFLFGVIGEVLLGFLSVFQLKKYSKTT